MPVRTSPGWADRAAIKVGFHVTLKEGNKKGRVACYLIHDNYLPLQPVHHLEPQGKLGMFHPGFDSGPWLHHNSCCHQHRPGFVTDVNSEVRGIWNTYLEERSDSSWTMPDVSNWWGATRGARDACRSGWKKVCCKGNVKKWLSRSPLLFEKQKMLQRCIIIA